MQICKALCRIACTIRNLMISEIVAKEFEIVQLQGKGFQFFIEILCTYPIIVLKLEC